MENPFLTYYFFYHFFIEHTQMFKLWMLYLWMGFIRILKKQILSVYSFFHCRLCGIYLIKITFIAGFRTDYLMNLLIIFPLLWCLWE